ANDKVVTAVVDGVAFSDPDMARAVRIAGQAQPADHPMAVKCPMNEFLLLAEVLLLGGEVKVAEQLPAKVIGAFEADGPAARARPAPRGPVAAAGTGRGVRLGRMVRSLGCCAGGELHGTSFVRYWGINS